METTNTIRGYDEATGEVIEVPVEKITTVFGQGVHGVDYLNHMTGTQYSSNWLWAFKRYVYEPSGFDGYILLSYGKTVDEMAHPHRCDCEYCDSELTCGHVAGGCNHDATITVRHYGQRQHLCQACFDATCNPDIYPLQQKLRAEFEVIL